MPSGSLHNAGLTLKRAQIASIKKAVATSRKRPPATEAEVQQLLLSLDQTIRLARFATRADNRGHWKVRQKRLRRLLGCFDGIEELIEQDEDLLDSLIPGTKPPREWLAWLRDMARYVRKELDMKRRHLAAAPYILRGNLERDVIRIIGRIGVPTGGNAAAEILANALEAVDGRRPLDPKRRLMFARRRKSSRPRT